MWIVGRESVLYLQLLTPHLDNLLEQLFRPKFLSQLIVNNVSLFLLGSAAQVARPTLSAPSLSYLRSAHLPPSSLFNIILTSFALLATPDSLPNHFPNPPPPHTLLACLPLRTPSSVGPSCHVLRDLNQKEYGFDIEVTRHLINYILRR